MNSTDGHFVSSGWRTNSIRSHSVETIQQNGREYLQLPLVALTEMVYEYPEQNTSEYLPAKHIRETANLWDGTLLTYVHPKNREKTVRDPDSFMGDVIGAFHDPRAIDGGEKLMGNGLIDVEKAKALGGSAAELVELLQRGEEVSVSAGYTTTEDEYRSGQFDGEQYDLVQGPPLPDHIAIFPSDSQMRARCSPEDGCAAPRANASDRTMTTESEQPTEYESAETQTRMSETESDVPTTEEQRQLTNELADMLDEVESTGQPSDGQTAELQRLRAVVDSLGQVLENESADVRPALNTVVEEAKALVADVLNDAERDGTSREAEPETDGSEKANAGPCGCGGRTCSCSHDRLFTSSSDETETGESLPGANMAAVPGRKQRDLDVGRHERQRENADEYPAGGRKSWERRQVGLADVADDDDRPPAGGRSDYERRKQNARNEAEQAAAETQPSAAARRSATARQNAVDVSAVASADYPLTALRAAQRRAEKRDRQAELKAIAKRNDTNTVRSRHDGS